ncbi:lines-like protein 1 [Phyllostomus discolor]|uniref:Lines-like protein 1 n=1 Tax=Phyllostomus discolor TaxID=89673 RepID=A0A834DCL1_9CHIR|nr:lines-like protein 1 [Phyllostomus discolor]
MEDFLEVLEQLYKKVLRGAALEHDTQGYVCYLNPAWPDQDGSPASSSACADSPGVRGECQQSPAALSPTSTAPVGLKIRAQETALLQLTVVQITLSNSWITFCQRNLCEYSENEEVVYCLYTLTAVIKEIFKDTRSQKTEILKQFLTPLDATFEVFYNSLFSQHLANLQDTSKIVNSLIYFLELLELLIASRIHLGLHFPCQRIFFLKPSCVLHVITWLIQAFVKRKFIIFIKKCLLRKVGEDLCRGPVAAFMPPDEHLDGDMLALADAVLQAVGSGLLKTLSVHGKPSCFGGGEVQPGCECLPGPDHVILRAASLLLIKSLDIKFQNCASAKEMKGNFPNSFSMQNNG